MLTFSKDASVEFCTTEAFPNKGVYILIILIQRRSRLKVGALGNQTFTPGHYSYIGSAQGKGSSSLPLRVSRHQRRKKKVHWHIDYLLNHENSCLKGVIVLPSEEQIECRLNQLVKRELKAETAIPKFGATDCPENCNGHLLFFPKYKQTSRLIREIAYQLGKSGLYTLHIMHCYNRKTPQPVTNSIIIRKGEIADLEELEKIERECFVSEAFSREQIVSILQNLDSISLVAEINGETVGFILGVLKTYHGKKAGHIHTLDVIRKARRKGIGQSLLERFEDFALQKGAELYYLEVRTDNTPALKLYHSVGYRKRDTLPSFYGKGKNGIRMTKQL